MVWWIGLNKLQDKLMLSQKDRGSYNINSQFAVKNKDGSVTVNFGGDKNALNYMGTLEGWTLTLNIYQPQPAYFNGDWVKPELKLVKK